MPTTIRARLFLLAGLLLAGSLIIAVASLDGLRRTVSGLHTVYLDRVVPLKELKTISDLYAVDVVDASHKARIGTFELAEAAQHIEKARGRAEEIWRAYLQNRLIPEERQLAERVGPMMAALQEPLDRLEQALRSNDRLALQTFIADELYQRIDPLTAQIGALIDVQLDESERQYQLGIETYDRSLYLVLALLALMLLIGALFAWRLSSGIWRQLGSEPGELARLTRRIAQGQLAAEQAAQPRLGVTQSVETMRASLHEMIGEISTGSEQLETASLQLATSADQVLAGANHQSEIAASMAAAMEELSVSIAHIAESAQQAEETASRAGASSLTGRTVMEEAVREINTISQLVAQTTQDIEQLAQQSENISSIVGVIRSIADQTNLLALNAAIEAARAGEQGRGFAVVADEVRSLAARTAASTAEIVSLVEAIQNGVGQVRQSMQAGRTRVGHGLELVEEAGLTMQQINQATDETRQATTSIAISLKEQRAASDEVAMHVERVAQIVEENTAAQGGIAESTHALRTLGQDLLRLTHRFSL